MSEAEIEDLGEGRFAVRGVMGFDTVADLLEASREAFADHPVIELDFSGVVESDSAGLALLLEWVNWAKYYVREIHYKNLPQQIISIAQISELEDMLHAGERWTSQKPRSKKPEKRSSVPEAGDEPAADVQPGASDAS